MALEPDRAPQPIAVGLEALLHDLCVDWGFCLSADKRLAITTLPRIEARQFALAVLSAEGFDTPQYETKWLEKIAQRFLDRFGTAAVEP